MKAIVVVDIPRYCAECQCCYGFICFPLARDMGMWAIRHGKPVDCPLKPMPKKYIEHDITIETERDASVCSHGITLGWNACIEEILNDSN